MTGPWAAIPDDVLSSILDQVDLCSLLHILLVNKHWRKSGFDHPVYWKYPSLASHETSPADIGLFTQRMDRAHGRPVFVSVALKDPRPVLPSITQHLAHIERLDFEPHITHVQAALDALCAPAPNMRIFTMYPVEACTVLSYPSILSDGFLAGARLHWATLCDIDIFSFLPACFLTVNIFEVGCSSVYSPMRLPALIKRCTCLELLSLQGNVIPAAHDFWDSPTLQILALRNFPLVANWYRLHLPIASVKTISVHFPDAGSVVSLADHLTNGCGIELEFYSVFPDADGTRTTYSAQLTYPGEKRARMMMDDVPAELPAEHSLRGHLALAPRIAVLALPVDAWDLLLVHLGAVEFPILTHLRLRIPFKFGGAFARSCASSTRLRCNNLRELSLRYHAVRFPPATVEAGRVADFVASSVAAAHLPLLLHVSHVLVKGWNDAAREKVVLVVQSDADDKAL